jgi:hypothetical protein
LLDASNGRSRSARADSGARRPSGPQAPPPAPSAVALPAAPAGFASLIVADFPELFEDFGRKRFTLLWRGSRDGFGARGFHGRCNCHAPTLTLIEDTEGNIFGGFMPVKWESQKHGIPTSWRLWYYKAGPSLKTFIFTLKNPHNYSARTFALKIENRAIECDYSWGPFFRDNCVPDNCNAKARSCTSLGRSYTNDSALDEETFFTGSPFFRVEEIEMFEIAD